jgi:Holliday junction resolvasome RuvABC endonuclease subunit
MTSVVGLDLSLTATGIAYPDGTAATLHTGTWRGMPRLGLIWDRVAQVLNSTDPSPDLVVIEGYSYASQGRAVVSMGELGGLVRYMLWRNGWRYIEVAPGTLKKYATGKGSASKNAMLIAARDRLGYTGEDNDQADALWLRAAGHEVLGDPVVDMPKANRAALDPLFVQLGEAS